MATPGTCLKCGKPLTRDAREGFCPACLFLQASALTPENEEQRAEDGGQNSQVGVAAVAIGQSPIANAAADKEALLNRKPQIVNSFGDYELLEEIGRGGMGVVYRAHQRSLNRVVAIKVMAFGPGARPEFIKRFRAEAVSAASLHHPNIVAIHEVGIQEGQHFFVMDYIEGQSLARLVGHEPLPARRAAGYLKIIAEAVHYAHERSILHRDLKPSNVLIDADDQPHVVDFGLARRLDLDSELTITGQVLGSPNYLPPEQATGQRARVSRRTDVYALGATLYHLLTGRPPFQGESVAQTLEQVVHADPVPPRLLNPSLPRDLETVCLKCLEKEPSRRYPTAQALADELGRFLTNEPIQARPVSPAGKLWRWCRRKPQVASLAAVAMLTFLLGFAGVVWEWRHSEGHRRRAEAGELSARENAYAADMKELQRALDDSDLGRARELLNRYRPDEKSEGPGGRPSNPKSGMDLRGWEWRYFWSRCRSDERFTLWTYSNSVSALAFSADGKYLAVRHGAEAVSIWDAVSKRPTAELPAQGPGFCNALAFSPRGYLLAWATVEADGKPVVRIRDLAAQRDLPSLLHTNPVLSLAFSPDAKALATLVADGTVRLWDLASHTVAPRFEEQAPIAEPATPTPLTNQTVEQPGAEKGPPRTRFVGWHLLTDHYRCVLFSPDGRWLAIGSGQPRIRLLDRATGKQLVISMPPPADGISALAFSPDSRLLAAACGAGNKAVYLRDLAAGKETWLTGHSGWIVGLAFSPDGQTLASVSTDQTLRLWDVRQRLEARRFQGNPDEVWAVAWSSADGRELVTGGRDGSIRYWDPAAKPAAPCAVLSEHIYNFAPAFFPNSRNFLAATKPEGEVLRWETVSGRVLERLSFLGTNRTCLALSPDGRWLALAEATGTIQVWDFNSRRQVADLPCRDAKPWILLFSPHGRLLLCGAASPDGRTVGKLWVVDGWREIGWPGSDPTEPCAADFSPDERTLAVCYQSGRAVWWDLASGQRRAVFELQPSSFLHGVFSPDGRRFATTEVEGGTRLWDAATRRTRTLAHGYHVPVFSPDGRRLVASGTSPEGSIKFWDVTTGREVAKLQGRPGWYTRLTFSPDGKTLFAASLEGTAVFWHAPSFAEIEAAEKKEVTP